ncbi:MAG: EAL domain-containing protein [Candidatus Nitricoxidivorans perseverans]|uniref:EAL domain-containing protein n=1 Tax=Candidatus Nitricoxidivorans perseverans TaxID=2975601 RepID=A0AA49FJY8_9PROT|nr:MAG: EAL domain-containing protein [Candidatus Nitricoxidivorans perseverans]
MTPSDRPGNYWRLSALSVGIALLAAFVLLAGQRWQSERASMLDDLSVQAALIGANASAALAFNDEAAGVEILAAVRHSPVVVEAALYRPDGSRLVGYLRAGPAEFGKWAPMPGHVFSAREARFASLVTIEGRIVGSIALRATLAPIYDDLARFLAGFVLIALVAAALAHLAGRGLRLRMLDAERELERLALYDPLTGLANRRAFEQALDQTAARHRRDGNASALLYMDVDGFKKVNDMRGHQEGDLVLKAIGERLRRGLRSADVLARLGGDEFGAMLVGTGSPDDAARVAGNLIKSIAEPFETGGHLAYLGLSVGIAMIPADGDTAERFLHNADLAMYHAKQSGRGNSQFFSDRIDSAVRLRLDIESDLRAALRGNQFFLVYQPQVDARSGELAGVEALVRWRHPVRGVVAPMEFIPVAEDCGLIVELGQRVLSMACADIAALRDAAMSVPPVAINISARQLSHPRLCKEILLTLSAHGLHPAALEIELTESVAMDKPDEHEPILSELKASGFRIAIDDFGTGYSSLSYLKRLPVHKLKIDRSFVRDLPDNAESEAIARSIVDMAHALGLRVIAEGAETIAQVECLRAMGCDLLQGYYTGRPMERAALEELLAAGFRPPVPAA